MELRLEYVISNLLLLVSKSLITDTEGFFLSVRFALQFFLEFFSTLWMKMQTSNTCVPLQKHTKSCGDENRMQIAELNLMMGRLGMGWLDECGSSSSISGLFDEEEPSFDEIKETFGVFDVNKDGFIDATELQLVLCNLGLKEGGCLEECKRMIESCDDSGDGVIDFHGFVKFMEKCLC
ncbi:hypothetical protein ACS0TY_008936 [Phlomoides rotata]